MEVGIAVLWGTGLIVLCALAWGLNFISLPGNWLAVALIGLYFWLGPADGRVALSWPIPVAAFMLALAGELFEFVAAALGAKRAGASRRSTLFAVLGSLVGAIVGAIVGLPIPFVGSVVAALLFGAGGALGGAMYGEWTDGKSWQESWTVGHAAFWGRLLGTLGKVASGAVIVVLVLCAVLL